MCKGRRGGCWEPSPLTTWKTWTADRRQVIVLVETERGRDVLQMLRLVLQSRCNASKGALHLIPCAGQLFAQLLSQGMLTSFAVRLQMRCSSMRLAVGAYTTLQWGYCVLVFTTVIITHKACCFCVAT